jgi:hypothetical protein
LVGECLIDFGRRNTKGIEEEEIFEKSKVSFTYNSSCLLITIGC